MVSLARPADHLREAHWTIPLSCALFLHLIVLGASLYAPGIFKSKPKFAEIQTVRLVSLPPPQTAAPETAMPTAAPPQETQSGKAVEKTAPVKKQVPVAERPVQQTVVSAPVSQKMVSLHPRKTKKKKKVAEPEKPVVNARKQEEIQRVRKEMQELTEQIRQEAQRERQQAELERNVKLAAEKARLAREALEEERALFRSTPLATSSSAPKGRAEHSPHQIGEQQGGKMSTAVQDQYGAAVKGVIQSHWAIPPTLEKRSDLKATVVITINQDGQILDMFFEKHSGDTIFDQFIQKSIDASNPLPPIPPALGRQRLEFALNFFPSGVSQSRIF